MELAKTGTSAQLHRRAAASRGKLLEERRKAQTGRYLAFKPEEDGQSTRIHGRLLLDESKHLEAQLRKISDRLWLCDKERPSPSARMADALLILTKHNPSQALHDHGEQTSEKTAGQPEKQATGQQTPRTQQEAGRQKATTATGSPQSSTARPKLYALTSLPGNTPKPRIDYDEEPFPKMEANTAPIEFDEETTQADPS